MDDILWIGSTRNEFHVIASSIERTARLRRVASLAEARGIAAPRVAILAQARPGEFEETKVTVLRGDWKETRFVYVLGDWCCGQKRIRAEFSRVNTVYAHAFNETHLQSILRGGATRNLTSGAVSSVSSLVAVYSPMESYRAGLAETLAQFGLKTVESEVGRRWSTHGVDFVVWHASNDFDLREEELETLLHRHPEAKILALLTYPRGFELADLNSREVLVLAQPFDLRDLLQAIQPAASQPVSSAA